VAATAQRSTNPVPAKALTAQTAAHRAAATEEPGDHGTNTGIKVHGHWTIEVRNPDGKVVTHREFENSLNFNGSYLLSALLARQNSIGGWSIFLGGQSICAFGGGFACAITEPSAAYNSRCPLDACAPGLNAPAITVSATGTYMIISGAATVPANGLITTVGTAAMNCHDATVPDVGSNGGTGCFTSPTAGVDYLLPDGATLVQGGFYSFSLPNGSGQGQAPGTIFTQADLSGNPVNFTAGQLIAVTVKISFS
jgi:hypothetical protein